MSLVRVVTGLVMATCFILGPTVTSISASHSLIMAALGISIGFGFLTRVTGIAVSAIVGYQAIASFSTLTPDVAAAALASVAFIFAVLGPGKYSCDSYLRNMLRRSMSNTKKNSTTETGFDYRAYNNIDSRLNY